MPFEDKTKVYKRVETKRTITLTPDQVIDILREKVGMPRGEVNFDVGYNEYVREVTITETTVEEEGGLY